MKWKTKFVLVVFSLTSHLQAEITDTWRSPAKIATIHIDPYATPLYPSEESALTTSPAYPSDITFLSAAWNHDGTMLALALGTVRDDYRSGLVQIYGMSNSEPPVLLRALHNRSFKVYGIAYRPDGKQFALVDLHGMLRIYNTETFSVIYTWQFHASSMRITYSSNGRLFAVGGGYRIYIYNSETFARVREFTVSCYGFKPQDERVLALAFNPEGSELAIGMLFLRVFIYDLQEFSLKDYRFQNTFRRLAYTQEGTLYLLTDRKLMKIRSATEDSSQKGKTVKGVAQLFLSTERGLSAFDHNNNRNRCSRFAVGNESGALIFINLKSSTVVRELEEENPIRTINYNNDGSLLAVGMDIGELAIYATGECPLEDFTFANDHRPSEDDYVPIVTMITATMVEITALLYLFKWYGSEES